VGEPRRCRARGRWTIPAVYELFPILREYRNRQGGFLSGGEQQMLTIARTLMSNPELLLLDEPSEGLAPLVVEALRVKITELKAQGLTILLAEHGVEFSLSLADRVYVLEKGMVRPCAMYYLSYRLWDRFRDMPWQRHGAAWPCSSDHRARRCRRLCDGSFRRRRVVECSDHRCCSGTDGCKPRPSRSYCARG
jgi:energy-coupling factor transporter ATP-binding protein EcfA2